MGLMFHFSMLRSPHFCTQRKRSPSGFT
jgi:hypothetical protein